VLQKSYKTRRAKAIGYIFLILFINYELFFKSTPEHFAGFIGVTYIWYSLTMSHETRRAKMIGYLFFILFLIYILFSRITPIIPAWNDIINKHYSSILDDLVGLLSAIYIFVQFTKEVIKNDND